MNQFYITVSCLFTPPRLWIGEIPIHEASTAPAVLPPLWLRGASSGDEVAEAALAGARIVPTGGG